MLYDNKVIEFFLYGRRLLQVYFNLLLSDKKIKAIKN